MIGSSDTRLHRMNPEDADRFLRVLRFHRGGKEGTTNDRSGSDLVHTP